MFDGKWSLKLEIHAKFANFFKTCMIFSEVNVNMAVKKLLIPLVYIRPFTNHFFGDDTFNFEKCCSCKKCILWKKLKFRKLCRYWNVAIQLKNRIILKNSVSYVCLFDYYSQLSQDICYILNYLIDFISKGVATIKKISTIVTVLFKKWDMTVQTKVIRVL